MGARSALLCALGLLALSCGQARSTHSPGAAGPGVECTRCHGSADNAAPPMSTHGATDWRDPSVGAHQAHVKGGALSRPVPCETCHVVPATVDAPGHMDGEHATVTFTGLSGADGASPLWTRETLTCSGTYCHGATLEGGRTPAPVWNAGPSEARCGGCHAVGPPKPHVQNRDCGHCHLGYSSGSIVPATHVDGKLDVVPLTCTTCHGSGESPAPPMDTSGHTDTTHLGVGAHQAHLRDGPFRRAIACAECHVLPTEMLHATGTVDLAFGDLARAGGAAPAWDEASATCASTYCHGATLAGGRAGASHPAPIWTASGQADCGGCHGRPPPAPHPQSAACERCHPLTVLGDGTIDVAGGHHVDGRLDVSCTGCHGSDANPAPPVGTHGETDTTSLAVGAHQAHLRDGTIRRAVGCTECHPLPSDTVHSNGTIDFAWGPLAAASGARPVFTASSATCASTYCHGATLAAGGAAVVPVWTRVDGSQRTCGSCHGFPPPAPHPANPLCNRCHPLTVGVDGAIDVAGGHHVDGTIDVAGLSCSSCHGSDANPAPPVGTRGETLTTSVAVGAHQRHLLGGSIRGPMPCDACHAVPASMLHANGTVELAFGALARTDRATPAFTADARCASTYCHGATLAAGGELQTPLWTGGASQAACGTCHGTPPPLPHPQVGLTACGGCHAETVNADGTIRLDAGRHVNGAIDVSGGGCSACHGSDANPAPPLGTHGETATTALAVGAHQAHVRDGAVRRALGCGECHVVPASTAHSNGRVDMAWGALATANGAAPVLSVSSTTATCASTYCHGATVAGGAVRTPDWTQVDGTAAACSACHGYPPPAPHPPNPLCNSCHPLTVASDGSIDVAGGRHVDGTLDVAGLTCHSCHGSDASPAPPVGTHGETATTELAVGAHQAHLRDGPLRAAMACTECHAIPAEVLHADGKVDFAFGPLATAGGAAPSFDASTARCSSTYCHGATLAAGGSVAAPLWTGGASQAACGTCHGNPPPLPHPQVAPSACSGCHADTVNPDGTIRVALGRHVDGVVQVSGGGCSLCHGSDASPAPPVGTHGETATTALAVGAHQAHVQDGAIHKALACSDCHVVPSTALHANGTVDMAWGALATTGGASPVLTVTGATATCASTYCHGATLAAGGRTTAPEWTKVDGTQASCDACHGHPPPAPHPPNPLCNGCHPLTVMIDGTIDVSGLRHIDGHVDVTGLTCRSCHGSPDSPAPPIGTRGETATTDLAVGAHQAHLRDGALRKAIACTECHVIPADMRHANGTVELTWGPLATTAGVAPVFTASDATCASTYCHGATLRGGTLVKPVWTKVDGTQAACGTCHGNPPGLGHPAAQPGNCAPCHPATVKPDGTIDVDGGSHIDGRLEASADCGACHDAPPRTGAHLAHAAFPTTKIATYGDLRAFEDYEPNGATTYTFGCGNCHPVDAGKHMDLTVEVELSPGVASGSLRARNARAAAYDPATGKCAGVYCHSSGQSLPAFVESPAWRSGAELGCDGCHGNPPAYASGGPGATDANGHLGLGDTGREFGHFVGLGGPNHDTKHGGGVHGPTDAAAPITCQTCHFETTDPANVGPSGFYWLDTTGHYALAGGDPARRDDPRWQATQCTTCHAPGGAPVGQGKVRPLRHVNGRRDVVFDPRTSLPAYASLPAAPDRPTRPYWLTHVASCEPLPPGAGLDGTTLSAELSGARWDPATKTCSSVPCHLADAPIWGRAFLLNPPERTSASCCRCHGARCGP